jgi:2-polyprenyl-3-methyl-5-hydroxy-6-metoxy-1,4-benzoquinol methylase
MRGEGARMITRQDWEEVASGFRTLGYLRHNQRRQEHLATLGLDLSDKTVLEVGCGPGDHTTFFLDRGGSVTAVEARLECCQFLLESYKNAHYKAPVKLKLLNIDVESMGQHLTEQFDIVYCYGLLYHIADPALVIKLMAERCAGLLLLETRVSFGNHEAVNPVVEPPQVTESFHGGGCRPTRPWLFRAIKAALGHCYVPLTQPAHAEFPTDWTTSQPDAMTRAVFVGSRGPLDLPTLVDYLPDRQARG